MYDPAGAYIMLLVVALLFMIGVMYMDIRSRRGWGLALLALALAGFGGFMTNFFVLIRQSPTGGDLASALIFSIYAAIFLALSLMVLLVALVEAGSARHWWWGVGLSVAPPIGLVVLIPVTLNYGISGLNVIGIGLGLIPVFIILAYGIARSVRPVPLRAV